MKRRIIGMLALSALISGCQTASDSWADQHLAEIQKLNEERDRRMEWEDRNYDYLKYREPSLLLKPTDTAEFNIKTIYFRDAQMQRQVIDEKAKKALKSPDYSAVFENGWMLFMVTGPTIGSVNPKYFEIIVVDEQGKAIDRSTGSDDIGNYDRWWWNTLSFVPKVPLPDRFTLHILRTYDSKKVILDYAGQTFRKSDLK